MSGKDKPDKMERKLDLGILMPVPIHLFPIIILTLLSQKVFLVYSKIKKKWKIRVQDLYICRSWMNISVIILIFNNSSGKQRNPLRSSVLTSAEGDVGTGE